MRLHRTVVAGGMVVCLLGAAAPGSGQDVSLRYRWTKGGESRTRMTQQVITTSSTPGGLGNASTDFTMSQVFRTVVEDVAADGTATLRQTIESIRVEFNTPAGKTVFDSTSTDGAAATDLLTRAMSAGYSATIGQAITIVASPTGTVQKIEGMARLLERVLNAQPQDRVAPDLLEGLRNTFSDDTTRDMLGWGIAPFPDRPLHAGDTWEDRLRATVPMLGATTTSRTWTLQEVASTDGVPVARLAAKLSIRADAAVPQAAFGPVAMQTGEGTGGSELLFDMARGRLQRTTTVLTQPMTMSFPVPNGDKMSMQMLVNSTLTLELIDAGGR